MISKLLRGIFYPKFLPKCQTFGFTVPGWKITVLNGGPPGKPIVLQRLHDDKVITLSYQDLEEKFLHEIDYIKFCGKNGFQILKKENNSLCFKAD